MTMAINELYRAKALLLHAARLDDAALASGPGADPLGRWWAWPAGLLLWVAFTVVVTLLAVLVCSLVDRTADFAGSGLPLIKYILSGAGRGGAGKEGERRRSDCTAVWIIAPFLRLTLHA